MSTISETKKNPGVVIDVDVSHFLELRQLLSVIKDIDGVVGIKIGPSLGLQGLPQTVNLIRSSFERRINIMYDYQIGGNDTAEMGKLFAETIKSAGVDSVVLFPFAGPKMQELWTLACLRQELKVLTGGMVSHEQFLSDEGGYVDRDAVLRIYNLAAQLGGTQFMVPGRRLDWVFRVREHLEVFLSKNSEEEFSLYIPISVVQSGDMSELIQMAGNHLHPIIGRNIYAHLGPEDRQRAVVKIVNHFRKSYQELQLMELAE